MRFWHHTHAQTQSFRTPSTGSDIGMRQRSCTQGRLGLDPVLDGRPFFRTRGKRPSLRNRALTWVSEGRLTRLGHHPS